MSKKVSKGAGPVSTAAAPTSADQADAAKGASVTAAGPAATDTPPEQKLAGTVSTDDASGPRAEGEAGDPAGLADALDAADKALKAEQDKFRKAYPHFGAAIDAWMTVSPDRPPTALRITAKHDGFRRAGRAHSKEAVDHPVTSFTGPEQMEQLFAEPNLTVQLV